ncbi:unnamed protein product [Parascedosporium putredinis]|uniref:Uncharacterized protein n=1 Tax=Parascedosporium putredinis TaxID=1442378 RepID=A0A9P1H5G2_9PEZI|nr:unnamed protein product [Parascedosporium putredinis]CAI7996345.1 unnamed protein product [Parascedosporium putredinis]
MSAALGMWLYYFLANESPKHPSANDFLAARPIVSRIICVSSMTLGLCIASFPDHNAEWAAWSNNMRIIFSYILPKDSDTTRFSTSSACSSSPSGSTAAPTSATCSATAGRDRAHLFPKPSGLRLIVCTIIWLPLNYVAAYGWMTYVDPWCARVTEKLVSYIKTEEEAIIAVERK